MKHAIISGLAALTILVAGISEIMISKSRAAQPSDAAMNITVTTEFSTTDNVCPTLGVSAPITLNLSPVEGPVKGSTGWFDFTLEVSETGEQLVITAITDTWRGNSVMVPLSDLRNGQEIRIFRAVSTHVEPRHARA